MARLITRRELIDRWPAALDRACLYMAYPSVPFNGANVGTTEANRRLYDWLPFGIAARQARGQVDINPIMELARRYLATPWQFHKPPEQEHRLLQEVQASIGISFALGYWPDRFVEILEQYSGRMANMEWATDKIMLMATAWLIANRPDRAAQFMAEVRKRMQIDQNEPVRGDETVWWPLAPPKYMMAMDWGHAGRVALLDFALDDSPLDIEGLTSALWRGFRRDLNIGDGTTSEDMRGARNPANPRALSLLYGYTPWLADYMPRELLALVSGRLLGIYRSYTADNDQATHGLGTLMFVAAGLSVVR